MTATGLRWFRAWKKSSWNVGYKWRREAYAYGRGGRYQVERYDEGFVVRYCPPYQMDTPWQDIGTAATQEEAIALAQAHNDSEPVRDAPFDRGDDAADDAMPDVESLQTSGGGPESFLAARRT